jgi:hypothetical protein
VWGDYALENKGCQDFTKKLRFTLDNILEYGTLAPVEKCAPTKSGRFAF